MSQLDISHFRLGYCDAEATGAVIVVAIAALLIVLTIASIDAHKARRTARKQALQRSMHRHPARHRAPRYTPLAVHRVRGGR